MKKKNTIGTMKGQGATEYLVILAVVLIIALVAIGIVSQQARGSGAQEKVGRAYWKSEVFPLTIDDYKFTGTSTGTLTVIMTNRGSDTITLAAPAGTGITTSYGGTANTNPATTIPGGATRSIDVTTTACGTSGTAFAAQVNITYSTPTLTGLKIIGQKPLVSTCI